MPGLMHLVSLQQAAGVESHFAEFVRRAATRYPQWSQGWLNPGRTMHPFFREQLRATLAHTIDAKHRWHIKLPSKPDWIRSRHCRRSFRAAGTNVVLIWNRTAKAGFVLDAIGARNCIHWEHGAAWDKGRERERERYLRRIPLAIANSRAAARVLQLLWGFSGDIRICLNALRPSLRPEKLMQKSFPAGRAIKLGMAARLFPVKGGALALHAVKLLGVQGVNVELHIAGAGPELTRLQSLARALDIAAICRFHGAVADMRGFYRDIDCLLHPPLTEAFGLVAIEAAAHGCPVIAAAVDGLPEAVADGVSGYCVAPLLPLSDYLELGGSSDGIPAYVYDAASDSLHEPRIVDPGALAKTVQRLFSDTETYERMSRSASEHVSRGFDFDAHVDEVMGVINELAGSP
ncbi:MAG TPA: glycosyltransferase family 4 protein [Gammaproteobacteria bacterium]|nr:glycosyltransferase family 4 protein [Gammaproteobacteria bacterium]